MDCWARWPTLLGLCLLNLVQHGEAETAYTIDSVTLTLHPETQIQSGTNLTMRCEAKVSHSSGQLTQTFRFLKNGNVIYLKNSSDADVEYSLASARAFHSGPYQCQVQIHKKSSNSEIQNVIVTGLQTPRLMVLPRDVYEGKDVKVSCSAPEEIGNLQFNFYKNNSMVYFDISQKEAIMTLNLQKMGTISMSCDYTHPMAGRSQKSNTEKIRVKEHPMKVGISIFPKADVVEGDRVNIDCNVSDVYDHLEVFLTSATGIEKKGSRSFSYSLEANLTKSGEYSCKVEQDNVQKISTARLTVAELFSRPRLTISPEEVFEGQTYRLTCTVSNVFSKRITFTDLKYRLYKQQQLLQSGPFLQRSADSSTNGNYTCVAEANGVVKTSIPFVINVKEPVSPPVIRAVGQVIIGQPLQLQCESTRGTLPITYILLKSQKPVESVTTTGPLRSALFNITRLSTKDEIRAFSCGAHNQRPQNSKYGQDLDTHVIEPVSRPELTLGSDDSKATENEPFTMYCSVQQGSVPISFSWHRTGRGTPLYSTRSDETKSLYTIKSMTREHKGSYYCEADNDAQETKKSRLVNIEVNLATWKKMAFLATGIFCIFLLLLIIIIVLVINFKKGKKTGKRKRGAELSVKSVHRKSNDPMRVSLTLDIEDNTAVNATPCIMERNVWSENVSSSDTDAQSNDGEAETVQSTEVTSPQTVDSDADEAVLSPQNDPPDDPALQNTNTENSEDPKEDLVDEESQPALEYVQINNGELQNA